MSAAATAGARSVVRVAARAFTHPGHPDGGNPVTVFLSASSPYGPVLSPDDQTRLARSCEWESVVAHLPPTGKDRDRRQPPPLFKFYMPSGEEVSFCAHAAMGAAAAVASEEVGPTSSPPISTTVDFLTEDGNQHAVEVRKGSDGEDGECEAELLMEAALDERDVPDFETLGELRDALGLYMSDVSLGGTGLPSYLNSSVARPKTLFPIFDVERLHSATNPKDPVQYRDLCDKIGSTGVYLYSPCTLSPPSVCRFECRQFPRDSGYPEDPGTGIAAAALAASLRRRGIGGEDGGSYEFYQGTAMGRRSRIGVRFGGPGPDELGVPERGDGAGHTPAAADGGRRMLQIFISGLVRILAREEGGIP